MTLYCGCSGFSYKEWKGPFYPEDIKNDSMLAYYASKIDTVEINNTFYRMPRAPVLEGWASTVPDTFRFVLKGPRRITHQGRLKNVDDAVAYLWKVAQSLGDKCGPFLFQLPPYLRRDDERLAAFLGALPRGMRAAMEFRHPSWFDAGVFDILRAHGAALCCADVDDGDDGDDEPKVPPTVLEPTTDFGYIRLRRSSYDDAELQRWRERIAACGWQRAFVFFKHEDEGAAAHLAMQMASRS